MSPLQVALLAGCLALVAPQIIYPTMDPMTSHNKVPRPRPVPSLRTTTAPRCHRIDPSDPQSPCDDDPEYNDMVKEHVRRLLEQNSNINALIQDPSLRSLLSDPPVPGIAGRTRISGAGNPFAETTVCQSEETLVYPTRAMNRAKEWVFVLNQDKTEQALRVEKCIRPESPCNVGQPIDVKTSCKQKYIYRRMLTVGSNKVGPEEVLMPSCCVCYRSTNLFDVDSRTTLISGNRSVAAIQPTLDTSAIEAVIRAGLAQPVSQPQPQPQFERQPQPQFEPQPQPQFEPQPQPQFEPQPHFEPQHHPIRLPEDQPEGRHIHRQDHHDRRQRENLHRQFYRPVTSFFNSQPQPYRRLLYYYDD